MKKTIICLLTLLIIIFTFAACQEKETFDQDSLPDGVNFLYSDQIGG